MAPLLEAFEHLRASRLSTAQVEGYKARKLKEGKARATVNRELASGLSGRILHDFRRTAVRNLERAGVSRSSAMKMTGHKTEAVYRRYAIVSEQDLHEAAAKLAKLDLSSSPAQNLHSRA